MHVFSRASVKAYVYESYGPPDVLELRDLEQPSVPDDGVLVRVQATSVNPTDWHTLIGQPYLVRMEAGLRRPKRGTFGTDFAGTVEAVGASVTLSRVGDEVLGGKFGAFAEYVCVSESRAVVAKPANVTFEEAAAAPLAGLTALQGLRDKGKVEPGQKVLVNGASGGVGTFAVQIARSLGAEVTAVCSTRNVDAARSLGADDVVDYTREDFTLRGRRYDVMLDIAGNRSWSECKRVLADGGRLVVVGGPKTNRWIGPLGKLAAMRLASIPGSTSVVPFLAKFNKDDMLALRDLLESGAVKPLVERRYEFGELPAALGYLGEGHAQGKIVVAVAEPAGA